MAEVIYDAENAVIEILTETVSSIEVLTDTVEVVEVVTQGATGAGVIEGGLINQALFKSSSTDYDTEWKYIIHNDVYEIQGGQSDQYYHFNLADYTNTLTLLNGADSTLHYHTSDRARANHTGTQLANTISDFTTAVNALNHDDKANVNLAGDGITYGHIDDEAQYLYGVKTFYSFPKIFSGNPTDDTELTNKGYVDNYIETLDAQNVKLTGNQTIAGIKTFTSFPAVSSGEPTTDYQLSTKKYVDDLDDQNVKITGNQSIDGVKTFGSFPVTPSSDPTTDYETANKKYVDDEIDTLDGTVVHITGNETISGIKTFNDFPAVSSGSPVSDLQLTTKEYVDDEITDLDSTVVHITGNESIDGLKTFTTIPQISSGTPLNDNDLVNKKYVDDENLKDVHLTGNQSISGVKTFSEFPAMSSGTPSDDLDLTTKKYVDDENLKDVHLTGNQSVDGIKTFTQFPAMSSGTPVSDLQLTTKKYVDDLDIQNVKITGNQSVSGIKTFNSFPEVSSGDPTTNYQLSTKKYVDDRINALPDPLTFKGSIASASQFPTSVEVQTGWLYIINADVTDNDATKTNTGQSFRTGDEIAWNGTNWTEFGSTDLWYDDNTYLKPLNSRSVKLDTGDIVLSSGDISVSGTVTAPEFIGDLTGNADTVTNGVYTTDANYIDLTDSGATTLHKHDHDNMDGIDTAGTGITYGHINDQAQILAGVKSFADIPISSGDPTTDNQITNKLYVDTLDAQNVKITTNQTINGVKGFVDIPISSGTPTTDYQITNKKYVDDNTENPLTFSTGLQRTVDTITTKDSEIVHDNLSGFVSNEHIDHSTIIITAGNGLIGGGDITVSRTIDAVGGDGISVSSGSIEVDSTVVRTSGNQSIEGVKTFSSFPEMSSGTPATDLQLSTKKYVDDEIDTAIIDAVSQSISSGDNAYLQISQNLSDVLNQQTALNNITNVSSGSNEYVLTKDTDTGNAIWKEVPSSLAFSDIFTATESQVHFELTNEPIGTEYLFVSLNGYFLDPNSYEIVSGDVLQINDVYATGLDGSRYERDNISSGDVIAVRGIKEAQTTAFDPLSIASLVDGSINGSKITANSIYGTKLVDESITNAKIEDGTIADDKLVENYVNSDGTIGLSADWNVGNYNIIADMFVGISSGDLVGNVTGNVTGDVTGDLTGNADTVTNGVYTTGDQSIAGVKTFESFPITPSSAPTTDYQVANKKYITDQTPVIIKSNLNVIGNAPMYACRAWVNFDGTQAAANMIRESGNVSSITDVNTGRYQINFTTALEDINYGVLSSGNANNDSWGANRQFYSIRARAVDSVQVEAINDGGGNADSSYVGIAVFR